MWMWYPIQETLTPTGAGICGGQIYVTECYSACGSSSKAQAQLIAQPEAYSECSTSSVSGLWSGVRSGFSGSRASSSLDIGRGLTIINESGVISSDTTVLRFYGDTLYSDGTIGQHSDATVTQDGVIIIDGEDATLDSANSIDGGDASDSNIIIDAGDA